MQTLRLSEEDDFQMPLTLEHGIGEVYLSISDDLDSAYQPLDVQAQRRIWRFIDQVETWFPIAKGRVTSEFPDTEMRLVRVWILAEPTDDDMVFGLQFWCSDDIEHGRGLKIRESDFDILDYGPAEVAFL